MHLSCLIRFKIEINKNRNYDKIKPNKLEF